MSREMWQTIYENIQVPLCYIQAINEIDLEKDHIQLAVDALKDKPNFYHHLIKGRHHLHLTHPERVSGIISNFINKFFVVKSKL